MERRGREAISLVHFPGTNVAWKLKYLLANNRPTRIEINITSAFSLVRFCRLKNIYIYIYARVSLLISKELVNRTVRLTILKGWRVYRSPFQRGDREDRSARVTPNCAASVLTPAGIASATAEIGAPMANQLVPLEAEPRFDNRRFLRGKMSFKDNRIQRYALRRLESPRLFIHEILNHESNFHLNPLFSKTFIRIIRYRRKKKKKDLSTSIKIIPWFEN